MPSAAAPVYTRILLKLSGEALMGDQSYGIDPAVATQVAREIGEIQEMGVQTAVVIGGGKIFFRGAAGARGVDRAASDFMCNPAPGIHTLALPETPCPQSA